MRLSDSSGEKRSFEWSAEGQAQCRVTGTPNTTYADGPPIRAGARLRRSD